MEKFFRILHWPTLDERRISEIRLFVTQALQKKYLEGVNKMFQVSSDDNQNLRSNNSNVRPNYKVTMYLT